MTKEWSKGICDAWKHLKLIHLQTEQMNLKNPYLPKKEKPSLFENNTCFKIGVAQFSLNIWASEYVKHGTGLSSAYYV